MCKTGDIDDPGRSDIFQPRQKQVGQEKMSQMIRLQMDFVAIDGLAFRAHHNTGVVNQDVHPISVVKELLSKRSDTVKTRQIQLERGDISSGLGLELRGSRVSVV